MSTAANSRDAAVDKALQMIRKNHGTGAAMRLGEGNPTADIASLSTGSIAFDRALGIGGLPRGRIVEIYGPESSGKTSLGLSALAQEQAAGGTVAMIDAEHALDPKWARTLGVDTDALILSQPDNGESGLDIAETLVRSGGVGTILIDSVAALTPKSEIEGEIGDAHVGLQARMMGQAMRKLSGAVKQAGTTLIFINQIRHKIGVMFGSPETTTGGNALKFYASVRIDVRGVESIKSGDSVIGRKVRMKVAKNKCAPPFRTAESVILFDSGWDREGEILDLALNHRLIEKSGAWYRHDGANIGQGREQARTWLKEHPDKLAHLRDVLTGTAVDSDEASTATAEQDEAGRQAQQAS